MKTEKGSEYHALFHFYKNLRVGSTAKVLQNADQSDQIFTSSAWDGRGGEVEVHSRLFLNF